MLLLRTIAVTLSVTVENCCYHFMLLCIGTVNISVTVRNFCYCVKFMLLLMLLRKIAVNISVTDTLAFTFTVTA